MANIAPGRRSWDVGSLVLCFLIVRTRLRKQQLVLR